MRHLCREGASKIWSNYDDKNTRLYPIKNYVLLPNMQKKNSSLRIGQWTTEMERKNRKIK